MVRRLLAEIRSDRNAIELRCEEIRRYSTISTEPGRDARTAALALALDRAYTALESVLERVARTLEGGPPTGDDWHRTLLHNASLDIPGVRPAVLNPASIAAADEARRFRHFLRHAYAAELDAGRLLALAGKWLNATEGMSSDLDRIAQFLEKLARSLETSE